MSEVMTIGKYTISEQDLDAFIAGLSQEQQMYASIPEFREQVKDHLIDITLFALYAKELGLDEKDTYKAAMMNAERDIAGQMAMGELLEGITVSEEEAKSYFDAAPERFAKGPSASAKHILVDSEERAAEIKAEIESGAKTFEEAALEYSSCPSSSRGGSLGTFGRGQMVAEFDEVVFTKELNQIHGPVKTQFGYHLIWIDERTDGVAPDFDSVKEQVRSTLVRQKQQAVYSAKVNELKAKYL